MKKAIGILEILVVLVILLVLVFLVFNPKSSKPNPIQELKEVQTNTQIIDDKIDEIQETKILKEKIEKDIQESN